MCLERAFSDARTGRSDGMQERPKIILEVENGGFSTHFAVRACSMLTSSEPYQTLARALFLAHQSFRAARQKRRKIDPKARSTALGAPQALGRLTGRLLEHTWDSGEALGQLLAYPGPPGASESRPPPPREQKKPQAVRRFSPGPPGSLGNHGKPTESLAFFCLL